MNEAVNQKTKSALNGMNIFFWWTYIVWNKKTKQKEQKKKKEIEIERDKEREGDILFSL